MFKNINWSQVKLNAEVKFYKFLEHEKEYGSPITILIMCITVLFVSYVLSLF